MMDGKDVSSNDMCDIILRELCANYSQHIKEKEKEASSLPFLDLASLFGTIQNPLFQDFLTYFALLSQHTRSEVIIKLNQLHSRWKSEYAFQLFPLQSTFRFSINDFPNFNLLFSHFRESQAEKSVV